MSFILKAVHDNDLEPYLESLDILDNVKEGRFICKHCGARITLDTLQCLYPIDDEIRMCCDNPDCYKKALEEIKGIKNGS